MTFVLVAAVLFVVMACSTSEPDSGEGLEPGIALPADGKCRARVVLQEGENCVHEYSYAIGTLITASGAQPLVESASIVFRVDSDGIGHYGDKLSGTSIKHTIEIGDEKIAFEAYARDDGSFYIEQATQTEPVDGASAAGGNGPTCAVGMSLGTGESCQLPDGGGAFEVEPDGDGCYLGSLCSGESLLVGGFSAKREGDVWTVTSVP